MIQDEFTGLIYEPTKIKEGKKINILTRKFVEDNNVILSYYKFMGEEYKIID